MDTIENATVRRTRPAAGARDRVGSASFLQGNLDDDRGGIDQAPVVLAELYYHMISWLSRLHSGRLAVWIATTFEIGPTVDLDALRATFRQLLVRHEVLRTEFRMEPDPDGTHGIFGLLQCDVLNPDAVVLEETEVDVFDHVESLREALIERIDKTIDTNKGPVMLMGVVVGAERS